MKHIFGATLATFALLSQSSVISRERIPIGTQIEYTPGAQAVTGETPNGEKLEIQLSSYDQWWLSKTDGEQSVWLDFWLDIAIKLANSIDPSYTFVDFMTEIQKNQLSLGDFGLTYPGAEGIATELPAYAREIAQRRCENYRRGMSFDDGREKADQSLSAASKQDALKAIMVGSTSSRPTVLGVVLLAVNITRAVESECSAELSKAYARGSAYDAPDKKSRR
jgi:hypothetical protein